MFKTRKDERKNISTGKQAVSNEVPDQYTNNHLSSKALTNY